MLFVLVGVVWESYDEIAGAPVQCVWVGGVGSLSLVVLVALVALALVPLLLLVVLVALVALALEPCVGFAFVLVLGRGLAAVVLFSLHFDNTYQVDVGALDWHLRDLCCRELYLFDAVAGE